MEVEELGEFFGLGFSLRKEEILERVLS